MIHRTTVPERALRARTISDTLDAKGRPIDRYPVSRLVMKNVYSAQRLLSDEYWTYIMKARMAGIPITTAQRNRKSGVPAPSVEPLSARHEKAVAALTVMEDAKSWRPRPDRVSLSPDLRHAASEYLRVMPELARLLDADYVPWDPFVTPELPMAPQTSREFAEHIGATKTRINDLNQGKVHLSLDEFITLAAVLDLDPPSLLQPTAEHLLANHEVLFRGEQFAMTEVDACDWMLWIHGLAPLPTQPEDRYLQETSAPFNEQRSFSGQTQPSVSDIVDRRKARRDSKVSARHLVTDPQPIDPLFQSLGSAGQKFTTNHGASLSAAAIRMATETRCVAVEVLRGANQTEAARVVKSRAPRIRHHLLRVLAALLHLR